MVITPGMVIVIAEDKKLLIYHIYDGFFRNQYFRDLENQNLESLKTFKPVLHYKDLGKTEETAESILIFGYYQRTSKKLPTRQNNIKESSARLLREAEFTVGENSRPGNPER